MPDIQILASASQAAPKDYVLPGSQHFLPKVCRAEFDGSSAAGDFQPALEIISDAGVVVAEIPCQTTVTAGDSALCTFAPFLRTAASAPTPPPAGSGLPILTSGYPGIGTVFPATGGHLYPYDPTYGFPGIYSTDYSVLDGQSTSSISGFPVEAVVILAAGTYALYCTVDIRAPDAGVTGGLLSIATSGANPSDFFQGRYGASTHDTWENTTTTATRGEMFIQQWFKATNATVPVYLTPDVVVNGVGNYQANVWLNVVQLTPTPISFIN